MQLAVFDVDGVLADVSHRRGHISGGRRDWTAFFAAAADDTVLSPGVAMVLQAQGDGLLVVYLSGRPERLRATTLTWLHDNGLPAADLVLRADADHSPAVAFKVARLREIASGFIIALLVDDDEQVVTAVREYDPPLVASVVLADWQPAGARHTLRRAQQDDGRT